MSTDNSNSSQPKLFQSPDCIRCLRKKLKAVGVVVFFSMDETWYVGDYEADIPSSDAEFQFGYMLKLDIPGIINEAGKGLILNTDEEIQRKFHGIDTLFQGYALLGVKTKYSGLEGIRLAWRPLGEPFTQAELDSLECFGDCPVDCR